MLQLERQQQILDYSSGNKELTGRAYFFHERALENQHEKDLIAGEAIKLVENHMCIFLDASSTAYTLGMKLRGFTELTVITNGINLALSLKDIPGVTVILTGGIVTSASSSIEGLLGEDLLKKSIPTLLLYQHADFPWKMV